MFSINNRLSLLGSEFYCHVKPSILENSQLVHVNLELKKELGLQEIDDLRLRDWLSGEENIANYKPLATVYSGHQFGVYVPQLGDGRALIVAEHRDPQGRTWELQLKGSGKTPYSRMGDGLAVLRSSIREYLGSHALQYLGIPTTKALAIISSSTKAYREEIETAASILRVAPTFIRFGHFEFWAHQGSAPNIRALVKFITKEYFPELNPLSENFIPDFLTKVIELTAILIAKWQTLGFVHGVLNSDNMSVIGLTLDYGPYAFMDSFHPNHAYNHSDSVGRYVYNNQPNIGLWNLCRFAESLILIYPDIKIMEGILATYSNIYNNYYLQFMTQKLGISDYKKEDLTLIEQWLHLMIDYKLDWTYSWRQLSYGNKGKEELQQQYKLGEDFSKWYNKWQNRITQHNKPINDIYTLMQTTNPALVPRTHLLQYAIKKAHEGNYAEVDRLFTALTSPYQELSQYHEYYQLPPDNTENVMLSCSS